MSSVNFARAACSALRRPASSLTRSGNKSPRATISTFGSAASTLYAAPEPRPPHPMTPTRILSDPCANTFGAAARTADAAAPPMNPRRVTEPTSFINVPPRTNNRRTNAPVFLCAYSASQTTRIPTYGPSDNHHLDFGICASASCQSGCQNCTAVYWTSLTLSFQHPPRAGSLL